jgi:hypothetical protein
MQNVKATYLTVKAVWYIMADTLAQTFSKYCKEPWISLGIASLWLYVVILERYCSEYYLHIAGDESAD